MKTITLLAAWLISFAAYAQTSTLYLTTFGGQFPNEKWVEITTGPDGSGTIIWAQGNGFLGNGDGLVTDVAFTVNDGQTYYINCYDRLDDGWDGTVFEIRDAPGRTGRVVAYNNGNSPDDGNDEDNFPSWENYNTERELSEAFSYTPSSCTLAEADSAELVPDCPLGNSVTFDVTSMGSASSLTVTNNAGGTNPSPITAIGTYTITDLPTDDSEVLVTLTPDDDADCFVLLERVRLLRCPEIVECSLGSSYSGTHCYQNNTFQVFDYESDDGSRLILEFNDGQVETDFDELVVYDSDGTVLYDAYGFGGDVTGLRFESSGTRISFGVRADDIIDCFDEGFFNPLDYDVTCSGCVCPPVNDNCSGVLDLATLTSPITESICNARNDFNMNCLSNPARDVIYAIDVNPGDQITIGQTSNTYDSKHRVSYGQTCPGGNLISCEDDPDLAQVEWTNQTGMVQTVYWIQSAFSNDCGDFTLAWEIQQAPDPPANDECIDAITLTVSDNMSCNNEISGTTVDATRSLETTLCTTTSNEDDVWYAFTPNDDANYTFKISNPAEPSYVHVYSGSCSSGLSAIGDCFAIDRSSVDLLNGETYYVQIHTTSAMAFTDFDICVFKSPPPPSNDDCANATTLIESPDNNCSVINSVRHVVRHNQQALVSVLHSLTQMMYGILLFQILLVSTFLI